MRWRPGELSGTVAAWAVSVGALLVVVNPDPWIRGALALLVPGVVWLAFAGSSSRGACPRCGASARHHDVATSDVQVSAASRTEDTAGQIRVRIGWTVQISDAHRCRRCSHTWQIVNDTFVDRGQAPTSSEAVVLATGEHPAIRP